MKTLVKWLGCLLAFFLCGCGSQVSLRLEELPPVPMGKARIVVVYQQNAVLWKATPFPLYVDERAVQWVKKLPEFSVIDVEPGERTLAVDYPDSWIQELMAQYEMSPQKTLSLGVGETGYLYCFPRRADEFLMKLAEKSTATVVKQPVFVLGFREIDEAEAARLLGVTRVSG